MSRMLLSLFFLFIFVSPSFAQVEDKGLKDWDQLFDLMQRKDAVGKRAQQGWLEFSQQQHTKAEQSNLVRLWHKRKDEFSRKA
ncbi:MAG: hypothetical protein P1V97_25180, partial [Planctomycetota bacterium]|nr:hypothetical protein [Planctomycetota bacterium]